MSPRPDREGGHTARRTEKRVAVVTGASQGIGAGLVDALRREGYAVVATARSIDPSREDDLLTLRGDIALPETSAEIVERALDRFGRIDCLVNVAGVHIDKPFTEYTLEDFQAMTTVNLLGFFHITQRVIPPMLRQNEGHIVNITTSLVDHPNARTPSALVSLTKGGLAAVTRALAIEYAARGIRVNAVAPGVIEEPRYDASSYKGLAELHPLGRLGQIGDVVDAILYLDRATFVTGETVHVDGGQAAGG
jgi:NAD(P)-dependent dehydrogenase (short-subunit alcohol dehydrogenase family)